MPLAPTNIEPLIDDIDGTHVKITWTDPNTPAATQVVFFRNASQYSTAVTVDLANRAAFLKEGNWEIQLNAGGWSTKVPFTVVANDPPPPPPVLTDLEHLHAAGFTDAAVGDVFGRVTIEADLTVQADGSLS
jgi:hypothetical protein